MKMITKAFIKEKTNSFTVIRLGVKVKLFSFRFGNITISHCERVAECDYFDEYHFWSDVYIENVSYYEHVYENGTKIGRAEDLNEFITLVQGYYKINKDLWERQWKHKVFSDKCNAISEYTKEGNKIVARCNPSLFYFVIRTYKSSKYGTDSRYQTIRYCRDKADIMRWWNADKWQEYLSNNREEYKSF